MNQVPKLKCKIGKTIYNLFIFLVVVIMFSFANFLPVVGSLATINSLNALDVVLNVLIVVPAAVFVIGLFVTLYINWYKFVTYKETPKPTGRALVSDGSITPRRCSFWNLFC